MSVVEAQQQAGADGVQQQMRVDGMRQTRKRKRSCRRRSKEKGRCTLQRARSQRARFKGWIMTNCLSRQRLGVMLIALYTEQSPLSYYVLVSVCVL